MALEVLKTAETLLALEVFLEKNRPDESVRNQVDVGYRIDNQSVLIFDIRADWRDKEKKIESPIAKATWVKTQEVWKVYWMRGDLKWHSYEPLAQVDTIDAFLNAVDEDEHGCFWG